MDSTAVSKSAFDAAQSQARTASANLEATRSQVKAAETDVTLSEAGVEPANAAVQQTELDLSYTQVTAPEDGHVTSRMVEKGAYIQPRQSLMAIVPRRYGVITNFKETSLRHMRVGRPLAHAFVAVDAVVVENQVQRHGAGKLLVQPPGAETGRESYREFKLRDK